MRIVLGKTPDPRQTMQLATLFVAVNSTKLSQTQRQITVGAGLELVDFAVVGAVHGFEHKLFALLGRFDGLKRILAVFGPVARCHVEVFVSDVGSHNLQIARPRLGFAQKILQPLAQHRAFGQPKRQALAYFLRKHKKLQLTPQLAVVAFFGFF